MFRVCIRLLSSRVIYLAYTQRIAQTRLEWNLRRRGHAGNVLLENKLVFAYLLWPLLCCCVSLIHQGDNLLVFDGRTSRNISTLSTSKKVLLQLEYNHARDELISGGSDGCFVWRLEAVPCELYALGELRDILRVRESPPELVSNIIVDAELSWQTKFRPLS